MREKPGEKKMHKSSRGDLENRLVVAKGEQGEGVGGTGSLGLVVAN